MVKQKSSLLIMVAIFLLIAGVIAAIVVVNLNFSSFRQENTKYKNINIKLPGDNKERNLKIPAHYPARLYNTQCPKGLCPMLGKGYDTRGINLNDATKIPPGKQVFIASKLNLLTNQKCFIYDKLGTVKHDSTTTKDTSETIKHFANETSASINLPIDTVLIKATADATTKQDSSKSSDIQTASIKFESQDGQVEFVDSDTCRTNNINPSLVKDFFNLPINIQNPDSITSWVKYEQFFKKWGTHVVVKIIFGSRMEVWDSMTGNTSDITNTLLAKVCASIVRKKPPPAAAPDAVVTTPPPDSNLSIQACNTTTKTDQEKASKLDTKHSVIVLGGEKTARNRLATFKDMATDGANVTAFLDSSEDANQASGYFFTPIWEIITNVFASKCNTDKKFCDTNNQISQRITNMKFSFVFKAIDCPTLRSSDGTIYQQIRSIPSEDGGPTTYGCWSKGLGCTNDSGCKYSWTWGTCYALGPNVFQQDKEYKMSYDTNNPQYRSKPRTDFYGDWSWSDAVRNTCKYKGGCKCIGPKGSLLQDRFIWKQED
jgi:hypothetical protein